MQSKLFSEPQRPGFDTKEYAGSTSESDSDPDLFQAGNARMNALTPEKATVSCACACVWVCGCMCGCSTIYIHDTSHPTTPDPDNTQPHRHDSHAVTKFSTQLNTGKSFLNNTAELVNDLKLSQTNKQASKHHKRSIQN